jgi:DNA-directed RNA polymerase specialized sigma24 family protein
MTGANGAYEFHGLDMRIARARAYALIGSWGFTPEDREDIQQEILLEQWIAMKKYDHSRGSERTFLNRLTDNKVASMVAYRRAACREREYRALQLDPILEGKPIASSSPGRVKKFLFGDNCEIAWQRGSRPTIDLLNLRIDVGRVLGCLPEHFQCIAHVLQFEKPSEAAKRLNVSRGTIYRAIKVLKRAFEVWGLNGGM